MKIGAVAATNVAGVERVAAAPSGATLVVLHDRRHVLVVDARLLQRGHVGLSQVGADWRDSSRQRHQLVRLEVGGEVSVGGLGISRAAATMSAASSRRVTANVIVKGTDAGSGAEASRCATRFPFAPWSTISKCTGVSILS